MISGCQNTVIPTDIERIGDISFWGCKGITSISVPEGVESIGDGAFEQSSLNSVFLPASLSYIGYYIFADCSSLTDIYCQATTLTAEEGGQGLYAHEYAFDRLQLKNVTLHVPEQSMEDYRSMEPWSKFKNIVALKDGETAIKSVRNGIQSDCDAYYQLNGQRTMNPRKGLYIRNGQKTLVK